MRGIRVSGYRAWCVSRSERGDEAARLSSFLPIILSYTGRRPRLGAGSPAPLSLSLRPSVSVRGPLGAWVRVLHGTLSVAVCVSPREPLTKYIFTSEDNSRLFISHAALVVTPSACVPPRPSPVGRSTCTCTCCACTCACTRSTCACKSVDVPPGGPPRAWACGPTPGPGPRGT